MMNYSFIFHFSLPVAFNSHIICVLPAVSEIYLGN